MKQKYILLGLLTILLTGCGGTPSSSDSSSQPSEDSTPSSNIDNSLIDNEVHDGYQKVAKGENLDNRALYEHQELTALNSLGNQKILVVPVVFEDKKDNATEDNHNAIEKAFFGKSEETGWESVASYYKKSSFGQLTLTGKVMDYYYADYTMAEFEDLEVSETQEFGEPDNYWDQTHHIIRDIYEDFDAEVFKEFDQDEDGHVDALWMVYMNSYNTANPESAFWAYKFNWNQEANEDKPTPNTYAWASFDFAYDGKGYSLENNQFDAHTFIHETGHMFGLNDYYDYSGETAPAGKIDMMDNNVIDHNVYSKYLLNWVEPYYVTGDADITLRPAESSGDFILINDGWNGHAYDNYLLIEYYTPTGLNYKDSFEGYQSSEETTYGFTKAGVRMWHVDSRLIRISYPDEEANYYEYDWVDELEEQTELEYTMMGPVNSTNNERRYINEKFRQLHFLDAGGRTGDYSWFNNSQKTPGNGALFKEYQIINAEDWGKYFQNNPVKGVRPATFNDGAEVGYTVQIGRMTPDGVAIKIRSAK